MTARLVTRGDDAGSSRSANVAIRHCFEEGILRNASLMAPTAEVPHAVAVLAGDGGPCLGLHLTLTCEWRWPRFGPLAPSLAEAPWLEEDGAFPANGKVLHEREVPLEDMVLELEAQLARLRELGADPVYVDRHMGVGWVNGLDDAIAELCRREGLIDSVAVPRQQVPMPEGGGQVERALARIRAMDDDTVDLLVAHPCRDDDEMAHFATLAGEGGVGADRAEQARSMHDPSILAAVEAAGVVPARYDEVGSP